MSSSDPPQLHLSLSGSTNTFKRSFEQFGFDLESPIDSAAAASGSNNHAGPSNGERSKRQRSNLASPDASSFSDGFASSSSSQSVLEPSTSDSPTPDNMLPHDVEMDLSPSPPAQPPSRFSEDFRLSMERFNAFDSQISTIRPGRSSPPARLASPPPTLPPLTLPSPNLDTARPHPLPSMETLDTPGRPHRHRLDFESWFAGYTGPPAPDSVADWPPPRDVIARAHNVRSRQPPSPESPVDFDELSVPLRGRPEASRGRRGMADYQRRRRPGVVSPLFSRDAGPGPSTAPAPADDAETEMLVRSFAAARSIGDERRRTNVESEDSSDSMAGYLGLPASHDDSLENDSLFWIADLPSMDLRPTDSEPASNHRRPDRQPHFPGVSDMLEPTGRSLREYFAHNDSSSDGRERRERSATRHPRASSRSSRSAHEGAPSGGSFADFSVWARNSIIPDTNNNSQWPLTAPTRRSVSNWRSFAGDLQDQPDSPVETAPPRVRTYPTQSNSLVSETSAEWRRSMARSELISGLAQERQLVNRHAENTDADGPSVPLPSSRRNRSISSLFAPEEDSYMEFSPAMRDAIRRQRHQPHGLQVVDSPSDTESIRPAIERPLPTLRPLSRPIRPVSYNSRETRHPPSSGHSSRSMESDEVPFSTQAAAIFASRSTSPSSDHLAHHSAGGRQVPIPAPPPDSHTSRSPSPFPWASLRSLTPPPIPSSDMVRRRASMRSAMNAPTLFASSPPPPSDRQDSQRRAIAAASSTNTRDQPQSARSINVNAYHDGPFRASIERLVEIDRLRNRIRDLESIDSYDDTMDPTLSRPPSLPPLTFDHEPLSTFPRRPSSVSRPVAPRITVAEAASSSRARPEQRSRIPEGLATPVIHSRDDIIDREPRSFRRYRPVRQPRPVSPMLADTGTPTEGARDRRHLHTLLGRFPPAARAPDESPTSAASSAGGFAQAFAPIRGEGIGERHRQLVESQQAARRGAPAQWGAIQDDTRLASARRERERARERDMMRDSSMFPYEFFDIAPDGLAEAPLGAPARRASSVSRYHRLVRDREGGPGPDAFQRLQRLRAGLQGTRNVGDFVRDEDFDTSYEGLLSLAATLGDVRPRHTPEHVIASLTAGVYKDWATADSDQRCPICLDDYKEVDPVLKLTDCSHWLHKACLEQWLRSAATCPVCRTQVRGQRRGRHTHAHSFGSVLSRALVSPASAGPSAAPRDADVDMEDEGEDGDIDLSMYEF